MAETTDDHANQREADQDDKREEAKESCAGQPPVLHTSMSFSEVLHLVQSGENIPGLQKMNITATEGTPTPSQMARKPKPWEIIP